ncbi:MAG: ECF transporter S component [Ruthenibacterium sp.]
MRKSSPRALDLAQLALFGAIVIVLAFTPFVGYIPLGITKATIIHIPVMIGSILLGPKKGAVLGALFGMTSLISNTIAPTLASFTFSPFYSGGNFWSLVVCFVPRVLVGVVPYFVYRGIKKLQKNKKASETVALALAGLAGSMTNTLLVMNLIFVFFRDSYAQVKGLAADALYGFILTVIGINGVPEAIVAMLLTTVIVKALFRAGYRTKDGRFIPAERTDDP